MKPEIEVTDPAISSLITPIVGDATIVDYEIILAAGTYHLFAYNDAYDSEGHNATITVTSYAVTSSPSMLAWLLDHRRKCHIPSNPSCDWNLKSPEYDKHKWNLVRTMKPLLTL